jgi:hypothetical protein
MAVIPTNKLKNDFFGLQNGIFGGALGELLETFLYGPSLVLRGSFIFTKSVS